MLAIIEKAMDNNQVTIVIPVKNDEIGLERCLHSLTELCKKDSISEIIVIDNGSTDNTTNVAISYNAKLFINKNESVAGLRNIGSSMATGDIIGFIDSDCVADKMWIVSAINHFDDNNIACVGSMAKSLERTYFESAWSEFRTRRRGTQEVGWINSMNMFVRKDIFIEYGGFNSSLKTCEDVDLCYRISRKYKIMSDDNVIVYHYGEATNLRVFIKKEIWRGYSNLDGIVSHKIVLKELPSIFLPIYFLSTLLSMLISTATLPIAYLFIASTLHVMPFVFFLFFRLYQTKVFMALYQTYIMYFYAFARSIALVQRALDGIRHIYARIIDFHKFKAAH